MIVLQAASECAFASGRKRGWSVLAQARASPVKRMLRNGPGSLDECREQVSIAAGAMLIADAASNNSHLTEVPYVRDYLIVEKPIVIDDDAWIGAGVMILPGILVGKGAVIGAGDVVSGSVPPGVIAAGVPARALRRVPAFD
jgi:acetyltransferase-like isoleucine patch superfamily enzyme